MLAGVKSQMTGWLSGGIPGLGRGATEPTEGADQVAVDTNDELASRDTVQASAPDNVKDDDASRWVAGYVGSILHATVQTKTTNHCFTVFFSISIVCEIIRDRNRF